MQPKDLPKVLFVDDEPAILRAIQRLSRRRNWHCLTAKSASEAEKILSFENNIQVVVSDMRMPGTTGDKFLTMVREQYPSMIRILLTGYSDITAIENAVNNAKIYNYLPKPWDDDLFTSVIDGALHTYQERQEKIKLQSLTKRQNRQLGQLALSLEKTIQERTIEIEQALTLLQLTHDRERKNFHDTLDILTNLIEGQEPNQEFNHSRFVAEYASQVAKRLNLNSDEIRSISIAGSLHDIGLTMLGQHLHSKPYFKVTEEEINKFDQHPAMGESILSYADGLKKVGQIVGLHHAKPNGEGLPSDTNWENVPVGSKIISIVSDYIQLSQGQLIIGIDGFEAASAHLRKMSGEHYDQELVEIFLDVLIKKITAENNCSDVTLTQLKPGMMIQNDISTEAGILLLTKHSLLSEKSGAKLLAQKGKIAEGLVVSVSEPNNTGAICN
jgi:response regulator RpfG family c-di-GMP phosphodiesterase